MLTIYKASAGSGKTFTLTVRYLTLLVQNPQSYRNILAVTFTNKATEEMKLRILSQLYGLWQQLPASAGYQQQVMKATGMNERLLSERAGMALKAMIHHYSLFRVETIDAFFQTVLRGVARELGMTANWRLGLNDNEVEEAAVDQLIDDLATDVPLRRWVMQFIMERMADDRSWNVIGQLKEFGRNIFADFYKQEREALNEVLQQEGFFQHYVDTLRRLSADAQQQLQQWSDDFSQATCRLGLTDADFFQGSKGVPGYFRKLGSDKADDAEPNSYVRQCIDDPARWPSAKCSNREAMARLQAEWLPLLQQSLPLPAVMRGCQAATRHLHLLRLLGRIQQRVEQLNRDNNRLLLSDTQQRLAALIDGSDTPFIYEKTGATLEHVMIDEFQDTSRTQWQNFRLLLEEAMSHRVSHNLIVGDVKQSIYRWRGGDWQLLNNIDNEFPHNREQVEQVTLQTNWRSDRTVVTFNNTFFRLATQQEPVGSAYDDVEQQVPKGKPEQGYVSVTLLPADGIGESNYDQCTLERLVQTVEQLLAEGASPSSIAILVRYNRYIPTIARLFVERMPQVPIVSDDAFRLDASQAVCTIIAMLRALVNPDDQLALAAVRKAMSTLPGHDAQTTQRRLDDLMQQRLRWLSLPVQEMAEQLFTALDLQHMQGQNAYLCTFMDALNKWQQEQGADLNRLLEEWDLHMAAKTVQADAADGIRLLSIHRSKGLEFPHVIVPYCDWQLTDSRTLLWCHVEQQPYAQLPLIPVNYSPDRLKGTVFEPFVEAEYRQNVVDNMNLLYVAFTRAEHSLHVIGLRSKPVKNRKKAPDHRSWVIEQCLPQLKSSLADASLCGQEKDDAPLCLTVGNLSSALRETNHRTTVTEPAQNPFLAKPTPIQVPFLSPAAEQEDQSAGTALFRQSNDAKRFTSETEEEEEALREQYLKTGTVLHEALARIATAGDVAEAFRQLEQEGLIGSHAEAQRYQRLIEQRMAAPQPSRWFRPGWTLFRESSILTPKPPQGGLAEHHRPDRVMTDGKQTLVVDYKFGRPQPEHIQQVQNYVGLLRQVQMPQVKGFLWYVYTGEVVQVPDLV